MSDLVLSGISRTFVDPAGRRFEALRDVSLEVASGECFSLLGPSGCGKTTLLRIIAGLERPDSGTILMEGRDVTALPPEKRPTVMVFQSYALFPHLSVEGNVAFGLKLRKKSRAEIARKVEEVLELVQLGGLNRRRVDELSGGQQQRVALARVLAVEPSVLLMDEPLSNLDAALRRTTRAAIRRIQTGLGLTLIYVTHDQEEALMMSDRLALMREGRIVQMGSPRELFERPATAEVARFLGQRNMTPAVVRGIEEGRAALSPEGGCDATVDVELKPEERSYGRGDRVWLALRDDDVVLEAAHGDGLGWPGEVILISFAGSTLEVEVQLDDCEFTLRVARPIRDGGSGRASQELKRGDRVRLTVRPGAGLIYPREEGSA